MSLWRFVLLAAEFRVEEAGAFVFGAVADDIALIVDAICPDGVDDDAVGEEREAEAGARKVGRLGNWWQTRLTQGRCADEKGEKGSIRRMSTS